METTKNIFGKPDMIDGVGLIYPVKLKDYDEFIEQSLFLYYSKHNFENGDFSQLSLLELIVFGVKDVIYNIERVFSMVTNDEVTFYVNDNEDFGFKIGDGRYVVNKFNYAIVRSLIMHQNLMFERKVYKDKIVEQWANKVFESRTKNSMKMEFEDMISTVSVFTGKHYWDLAEYTVYQLKSDFNRISKFKKFDVGVIKQSIGSHDKIEHFAENIDLLKNPYDLDNFTKTKDKVSNIDKAMK